MNKEPIVELIEAYTQTDRDSSEVLEELSEDELLSLKYSLEGLLDSTELYLNLKQ